MISPKFLVEEFEQENGNKGQRYEECDMLTALKVSLQRCQCSQKELAGKIDVSEATISKWKSGRQAFPWKRLNVLNDSGDLPLFNPHYVYGDIYGGIEVVTPLDQYKALYPIQQSVLIHYWEDVMALPLSWAEAIIEFAHMSEHEQKRYMHFLRSQTIRFEVIEEEFGDLCVISEQIPLNNMRIFRADTLLIYDFFDFQPNADEKISYRIGISPEELHDNCAIAKERIDAIKDHKTLMKKIEMFKYLDAESFKLLLYFTVAQLEPGLLEQVLEGWRGYERQPQQAEE